LIGTNTVAYLASASVIKKKGFITFENRRFETFVLFTGEEEKISD
jgi:hypothetical protein